MRRRVFTTVCALSCMSIALVFLCRATRSPEDANVAVFLKLVRRSKSVTIDVQRVFFKIENPNELKALLDAVQARKGAGFNDQPYSDEERKLYNTYALSFDVDDGFPLFCWMDNKCCLRCDDDRLPSKHVVLGLKDARFCDLVCKYLSDEGREVGFRSGTFYRR